MRSTRMAPCRQTRAQILQPVHLDASPEPYRRPWGASRASDREVVPQLPQLRLEFRDVVSQRIERSSRAILFPAVRWTLLEHFSPAAHLMFDYSNIILLPELLSRVGARDEPPLYGVGADGRRCTMKFAVAAEGQELTSPVASHFERARYLALFDTKTGAFRADDMEERCGWPFQV